MALIRKLHPVDAPALRAHLFRLDSGSRHERFNGLIGDESLERYCQSIDWINDLLFGWFEDGQLRAFAQLAVLPRSWPRKAELALSVEPAWQDRGIGSELCREALLSARNRLIRRVCMICLMANQRMRNIVRRLEGSLAHLDGALEGELRLAPPNALSLWQEAVREGGGLVGAFLDQWRPAGPVFTAAARCRAA